MELLRLRSPVHVIVLLLVSIAPPLSAESIGTKVVAPTDPALQVAPPSSIHPSCRHLGTAQEIVDGVTVGEFACAAGTRGLICVRSAEGNATTPVVARKLAQGAVLTRAELLSIDAMMYAGLDALIVASSSGVMELQRALRAPNLEAMLRLMRVSRNRSYAMTARESSGTPYFPEGASVVVEKS